MIKVTKDSIIADIIRLDKGVIPILQKSGMNCAVCPSSLGETLEEAGIVRDMEIENLIDELNLFLSYKI